MNSSTLTVNPVRDCFVHLIKSRDGEVDSSIPLDFGLTAAGVMGLAAAAGLTTDAAVGRGAAAGVGVAAFVPTVVHPAATGAWEV